jgi:hypothetical protein
VKLFDVRGIKGDYMARLSERDETLVLLRSAIPVHMFSIHEKTVDGAGRKAAITHASLKTATVVFEGEITQWEDIRMLPIGRDLGKQKVEIYGKVISLNPENEKAEGVVRFTSVPAEAYRMLRKLIESSRSTV